MQLKRVFAPEADPSHGPMRERLRELNRKIDTLASIDVPVPTDLLEERNALAKTVPPLTLIGINIQRASRHQLFTPALLDEGEALGVITRARGLITIHGTNGDVVYRIASGPGLYCCHCGERLGDVGEPNVGRQHVTTQHAGVESPEHQNPAGYRGQNSFACVLVGDEIDTMTKEEAAEMWRGRREAIERATRSKHGTARVRAAAMFAAKQSTTSEG